MDAVDAGELDAVDDTDDVDGVGRCRPLPTALPDTSVGGGVVLSSHEGDTTQSKHW
jgi:hypothetical protein